MDQIMDGTKEPLHMTYRAVGSSTGILDFVGDLTNGTLVPRNDFGSGDIPLSTDEYNELTSLGIEILHLPVVLGAISLFHSVPNVPDLNLDSCIISKIFDRTITDWTDPEIVNLNPDIKELIGADSFPITVGRRNLGSSSTASFTQVRVYSTLLRVFHQSGLYGSIDSPPAANTLSITVPPHHL
jgi:ABC-type phosphate transport system substrate-binding protein